MPRIRRRGPCARRPSRTRCSRTGPSRWWATCGGPVWNQGTCITQTATPKSLTQTFTALSKVADELQGGDDPVKRDQVQHAVTAFDQATAGSGPKLNGLIRDLASAVRSPDAAIGHIGSLIDTVDELSMSVAAWLGKAARDAQRFRTDPADRQ